MSPEFGSTIAVFPIDEETLDVPAPHRPDRRSRSRSSRPTPRSRACGTTRTPSRATPSTLELDLATVVPSLAGPKRPQDRIALTDAKDAFRGALADYVATSDDRAEQRYDEAVDESFPASDSPSATTRPSDGRRPRDHATRPPRRRRPAEQPGARSTLADGTEFEHRPRRRRDRRDHLVHQHLEPLGDDRRRPAGQEGRREGPDAQAVGQDHAGARLQGRHRLLREGRPDAVPRQARLQPRRLRLHDLHRQLRARSSPRSAQAVNDNDLAVVSVLSGNRNFEGRINPDVKMNYLASPPLVVAYALAGLDGHRPRATSRSGQDTDGNDVFLKDIWPAPAEVEEVDRRARSAREMFTERLRRRLRRRRALAVAADPRGRHLRLGRRLHLRPQAAVLRRHAGAEPAPVDRHRRARGCSLKLGDSVTTDHISPGRCDQEGQPGRARTSPSTASSSGTSTPTARAAATTR